MHTTLTTRRDVIFLFRICVPPIFQTQCIHSHMLHSQTSQTASLGHEFTQLKLAVQHVILFREQRFERVS
jgi:hypothetical protein